MSQRKENSEKLGDLIFFLSQREMILIMVMISVIIVYNSAIRKNEKWLEKWLFVILYLVYLSADRLLCYHEKHLVF